MWYKRQECGLRMAIFFSAATLAGAFGGLLARGIMTLNGKCGLASWSWIFIIEGAFTVTIGESICPMPCSACAPASNNAKTQREIT